MEIGYLSSSHNGTFDAYVRRLADDSFVVAWTDGDGSESGIFLQRFEYDFFLDDLVPIGSVTRANTFTGNIQHRPRLIAIEDGSLLDGGWAVVWESTNVWYRDPTRPAVGTSQDGYFGGIYGQLYYYDGTKFQSEIRISGSTPLNQSHPVIVRWPEEDDAGADVFFTEGSSAKGAVLMIRSYVIDPLDGLGYVPEDLPVELFDPAAQAADLTPAGTSVTAFPTMQSLAYLPFVGGGLALTTVYYYETASGTSQLIDTKAVLGRFDGNDGPPVLISHDWLNVNPAATSTHSPRILHTEDPVTFLDSQTLFFVTWQETVADKTSIYGQIYDYNGNPIGAVNELVKDTVEASSSHFMTKLATGLYFMAWADSASNDIKGMWMSASGAAAGSPITSAITVIDEGSEGDLSRNLTNPRLAADSFGGVVISAVNQHEAELEYLDEWDMFENIGEVTDTTKFDDAPNTSDKFQGTSGNDLFLAGAGNDFIFGGVGNDTMDGGVGDDIFVVDSLLDSLLDSSGDDKVWSLSSIFSIFSFTGIEDMFFYELVNGEYTATSQSVQATGNSGNNTIVTGSANDIVDAVGGYNLIDFGSGDSDTAKYSGNADDDALSLWIINLKDGFSLNSQGVGQVVSMQNKNDRVDRMLNVDQVNIDGNAVPVAAADIARSVKADQYLADEEGKSSKMTGTLKKEVLDGLDGNDTLDGGSGDDLLLGRGGTDNLVGGVGNDTLDGGTGADNLDGGAGNDVYAMDADRTDIIADSAGTDTITTRLAEFSLANYSMIENLDHVGDNDFSGTGNVLANKIWSDGGNDTLDGGAGADQMYGGTGNDTYKFDAAADKAFENADEGTDDTVEAGFTSTLGANIENLLLTGTTGVNGIGNELGNQITGNAGANLLNGLAGNDTLIGMAGSDILQGGDGNDSLDGGADADKLDGSKGSDTLTGGTGNDTLMGGDMTGETGSEDTAVLSGNLADYLFSRVSNDSVTLNRIVDVKNITTNEVDRLIGIERVVFADVAAGRLLNLTAKNETQSEDGLLVNTASPFADTYVDKEDNLNDNIFEGLAGNDTLTGGTAVNTLSGGDGNDSIDGGAGNDSLDGGIGNDTLTGGTGNDTLTGGAGDDIYYVDAAGDTVVELATTGSGTDTVRTTLATYVLTGTTGDNVEKLIYDGSSNFSGTGNTLANRIEGGAGNDTLDGGENDGKADTLVGGLGDDVYENVGTGDVIFGELADTGGTDRVETTLLTYILGNNLENLSFSGTGKFIGTGNFANNVIIGGADADKLDGSKGSDTLTGGTGNDTLMGGDMTGETGAEDTVVLSGNLADYLFSRVSNDSVTLNRIVDVKNITTNEVDRLIGIERVVFADVAAGRLLNLTAKNETQSEDGLLVNTASPFADTYVDKEDNLNDNIFEGLAGNDTLSGGTAANTLSGGDGNDSIDGGAGNDSIDGGIGDDNLSGGAGTDSLSGGAGKDTLNGGEGIDTLVGGLGDDLYYVDTTDTVTEDSIVGAGSLDRVITTLTSYTLAANVEILENDASVATSNLAYAGNAGANKITTGSGNDTLYGGETDAKADTLIGGAGDDTYKVEIGDVVAADISGIDTVEIIGGLTTAWTLIASLEHLTNKGSTAIFTGTGNLSDNTMTGGDNTDKLFGLGGSDSLDGGAGNDLLDGGAGNDILGGGAGNDTLTGGVGADAFVFSTTLGPDNVDLISDFVKSQTDHIELGLTIFSGLGNAGDKLSANLFAGVSQTATDFSVIKESAAGAKIIYNSKTGELYFDNSGIGAGNDALGDDIILFAKLGLTAHPGLATPSTNILEAADFWLIA